MLLCSIRNIKVLLILGHYRKLSAHSFTWVEENKSLTHEGLKWQEYPCNTGDLRKLEAKSMRNINVLSLQQRKSTNFKQK